jgi:hypothetical protein
MRNAGHLARHGLWAFAAAAALSLSGPVRADFSSLFPAGTACAFDVQIDGVGGNQVYREFFDKDDNLVRTLTAGTGSALTFTNVASGATLSLKSNGAVTHVTKGSNGVDTYVSTGHNVIILFPTDFPAGPSTTLYVGRVEYTVDVNFTFNLLRASGQKMDICAAISS